MTDSDEKQRGLDATMENEASRDLSPMVQMVLSGSQLSQVSVTSSDFCDIIGFL